MASVEVRYDHVAQELQQRQTNKPNFYPHTKYRQTDNDEEKQTDRLRVMEEDIKFTSVLLRNGILAEATELELARQYDKTMSEDRRSWTKVNVHRIETESNENPKLVGQSKEQTGRLFKKRGGFPLENCLGQGSSIASVYSCTEEVNTWESSCAKDSGVSDLTVAATRRLSALVIHTGKDFEIMSVEEQDLDDKSSTHSRDQLDLARSVEKCKEVFELDRSYFSFEGNIRTSTPVEGSRLGLDERESESKTEKRSKAESSQGGLGIKTVFAMGRKKIGDGIIQGLASLMAAIL